MTWRIGNSLHLKTVTNIAEERWPALPHKVPWKPSDACLSPDVVVAGRLAACGAGWLAAGTQLFRDRSFNSAAANVSQPS